MQKMLKTHRCVSGLSAGLAALGLIACGDGGEAAGASAALDGPTWHQDIAPLVAQKCTQCHKDGGIAPFSLQDYDAAAPWAPAIAEAVESGRMPPFLAQDTDECTPRLPWLDDLRLDDAQKQLIRDWADAEAPLGDPDSAAEIVEPTPVVLEREDIKLRIPEPIEVSGTRDVHLGIIVDPGLDADTFVTSRLITSGNPAVLHHVVSYVLQPGEHEDGTPRTKAELEQMLIDEKGVGIDGMYQTTGGGPGLETVSTQMLDAWAPGGIPNDAPANSGQPLDKDALVLLDMHYHPTGAGTEMDDSTYLGLTIDDAEPEYISRTILLGNNDQAEEDLGILKARLLKQEGEDQAQFMIPAGEKHHVEEMTWEWTDELRSALRIYGMGTHMHYVGRDMLIQLENTHPQPGEPDTECLIETPQWDFNWQRGYGFDGDYDELPMINPGDVLRLRCVFDNSMENTFVVEALADQGLQEPVDVPLGEDTLDEMCLGAFGIVYPNANAN